MVNQQQSTWNQLEVDHDEGDEWKLNLAYNCFFSSVFCCFFPIVFCWFSLCSLCFLFSRSISDKQLIILPCRNVNIEIGGCNKGMETFLFHVEKWLYCLLLICFCLCLLPLLIQRVCISGISWLFAMKYESRVSVHYQLSYY